jgi:hypothetical protein
MGKPPIIESRITDVVQLGCLNRNFVIGEKNLNIGEKISDLIMYEEITMNGNNDGIMV